MVLGVKLGPTKSSFNSTLDLHDIYPCDAVLFLYEYHLHGRNYPMWKLFLWAIEPWPSRTTKFKTEALAPGASDHRNSWKG
jgi:hypothetical protein